MEQLDLVGLGLSGLKVDDEDLLVGATTPLQDVVDAPDAWSATAGLLPVMHALLAEFANLHPDWSIAIAEICAYRGEIDAAFGWLDRGFKERDPGMPQPRTDPLLEPLRSDPRWPKLLERIGLSDSQVAKLTLDVKLP